MSKKKKFKKKIQAEIQHQLQAAMQEKKNSQPEFTPTNSPAPIGNLAETTTIAPAKKPALDHSPENKALHKYAKEDIRRITLVAFAMLLILAGIYILSLKTDWVANLSTWLTKILHVS